MTFAEVPEGETAANESTRTSDRGRAVRARNVMIASSPWPVAPWSPERDAPTDMRPSGASTWWAKALRPLPARKKSPSVMLTTSSALGSKASCIGTLFSALPDFIANTSLNWSPTFAARGPFHVSEISSAAGTRDSTADAAGGPSIFTSAILRAANAADLTGFFGVVSLPERNSDAVTFGKVMLRTR